MDLYLLVKTVHVISSAILFGTGIGIAFFFFLGFRSGNAASAYFAAKTTVLADMAFTLPAGIVQPLSGFALIHLAGFDFAESWLLATYVLYVIALLCWLPVLRLQWQLREMCRGRLAGEAIDEDLLRRRFRFWFILGWPAFIALIAVFWLMVSKPIW